MLACESINTAPADVAKLDAASPNDTVSAGPFSVTIQLDCSEDEN